MYLANVESHEYKPQTGKFRLKTGADILCLLSLKCQVEIHAGHIPQLLPKVMQRKTAEDLQHSTAIIMAWMHPRLSVIFQDHISLQNRALIGNQSLKSY